MTYLAVDAATADQLIKLRTSGQKSKLYIAAFLPTSVYSARLASIPTTTDSVVEISFTSGAGTLANVLPDMTLYVGTSAGAYDLGTARIRKAPIAGTFYIGEESDIDWQGSCYLTVVNEFDIWAKHIRTVSDTLFYMDYDITYTDQNSVFLPVPIMGGNRVLKLVEATVSTQFNWSNSYCIDSSITGYSVTCSTATITGGSTSTPTLEFDSTGWHMVVLTVTAANGKTNFGVRYVYVYSDADPAVQITTLDSASCEYETGGWTFSITLHDDFALQDVPQNTLCILFAEDYYGSSPISIGQLAGCENVICVGKIAAESYNLSPEVSEASIEIQGYKNWLEKIYAFPTGVEMVSTTPTDWTQMQSPTVDKVVFRLLQYGSTALRVMDFYRTADTKLAKGLESPANNLWAQIQELAFASIMARAGIDRHGRLFVQVEPQVVPYASRTWPVVMTLEKEDWVDSVRMLRVVTNSVGQISSSGVTIQYSGEGDALFSLAPGHVFTHYGTPEILDRLLLSTQELSNEIAGLVMGWRNNPYPSVEFDLSANNRMIDCFPRQKVQWSVDAADTPRGFAITDGHFIPRRVEHKWKSTDGFLQTSIVLEQESFPALFINGDVPGGSANNKPPEPADFPDFPTFPILSGGDIPTTTTFTKALIYSNTFGFLYTESFDSVSPMWEQRNGGLGAIEPSTGSEVFKLMNRPFVTPGGQVFAVRHSALSGPTQYGCIWRAPSPGGVFSLIVDKTSAIFTGTPDTFDFWAVIAAGYDATVPERVAYVLKHGHPSGHQIFVGSGLTYSAGATGIPGSGGGSQTGIGLTYGFGKWIGTTQNAWFELNAAGTGGLAVHGDTNVVFDPSNGDNFQIKRGGPGPICFFSSGLHVVGVSLDNMITTTLASATGINFTGFGCDQTGQYAMCRFGSSQGYKQKSADFGASWSAMPSLADSNYTFWNVPGDANKWIAAGGAGSTIWWTEDFGNTWIQKTGNIVSVYPITNLLMPLWVGS